MFRKYPTEDGNPIKENYRKQRMYQNVDYVERMIACFMDREPVEKDIWKSVRALNEFVDISDPDLLNLANSHHLFQTAEGLRRDGHPEWLQVTGLLHDLGKIMYLWGTDETGTSLKEQWGIIGDTFIVGHPIPESIVYPEFNRLNQDVELGYPEHCGLDAIKCSWGHDEYFYRVLLRQKERGLCHLPEEALKIIRYHSLYLWHTNNEYAELMNEADEELKKLVRIFNKYDLYTKSTQSTDFALLEEYYTKLLAKYFPTMTIWW